MRTVDDLSLDELRAIVSTAQWMLWGDVLPTRNGELARDGDHFDWTADDSADAWNPDRDTDEDTLEAIADELAGYGLKPESACIVRDDERIPR